jgi:hypothetical protein
MDKYLKIHLFDRHVLLEQTGISRGKKSANSIQTAPQRLCENQFFAGPYSCVGNVRLWPEVLIYRFRQQPEFK